MSDDLVDPRANWKFAARRIDQLNDRIGALTARAEAAEAELKAMTAERDRAIDDAKYNAQYVDLVVHYRNERGAMAAENRRLREALEGAESWLDRWATHVGNCAGGEFCTCGLTFVRYETSDTLKVDRNE